MLAEQQGSGGAYQSLPVYFSNVCLRFLPVLDLMIQRFLECPRPLGDSIGLILEQMGSLYKFHGERTEIAHRHRHDCRQIQAVCRLTVSQCPGRVPSDRVPVAGLCRLTLSLCPVCVPSDRVPVAGLCRLPVSLWPCAV